MALDEARHGAVVAELHGDDDGRPLSRADRAPVARPPAAPQPVAPVRAAPTTRRRRPIRSLLLAAVLLAAAGYGGHLGYDWWIDGRFLVSTDDAYVQGDITILAAKMKGYVASVEVTNNQAVKTGDVIARLDDGDYRLALQSAREQARDAGEHHRADRPADRGCRRRRRQGRGRARRGAGRRRPMPPPSSSGRCSSARPTSPASRGSTRRPSIATGRRRRSAAPRPSSRPSRPMSRCCARSRPRPSAWPASYARRWPMAERDLSFTVVRAPVDGVVGNKAVQVGSYLEPGTRLAALVPLASVHVDANFKETQLGEIRPGQKVRLEVDAFPGPGDRGHGRERGPGRGLGVQPAAARERDRQLHQDRAARAGPDRDRARGAEPGPPAPRPVGGGQGRHPHRAGEPVSRALAR